MFKRVESDYTPLEARYRMALEAIVAASGMPITMENIAKSALKEPLMEVVE